MKELIVPQFRITSKYVDLTKFKIDIEDKQIGGVKFGTKPMDKVDAVVVSIKNESDKTKYYALVIMEMDSIHFAGNSYFPAYLSMVDGTIISNVITNLDNIGVYDIGIINKLYPAFIFKLKPNTGVLFFLANLKPVFNPLTKKESVDYLLPVEVEPDRLVNVGIYWDPKQISEYEHLTGLEVTPIANPYFTAIYNFKLNEARNVKNVFKIQLMYFSVF